MVLILGPNIFLFLLPPCAFRSAHWHLPCAPPVPIYFGIYQNFPKSLHLECMAHLSGKKVCVVVSNQYGRLRPLCLPLMTIRSLFAELNTTLCNGSIGDVKTLYIIYTAGCKVCPRGVVGSWPVSIRGC